MLRNTRRATGGDLGFDAGTGVKNLGFSRAKHCRLLKVAAVTGDALLDLSNGFASKRQRCRTAAVSLAPSK